MENNEFIAILSTFRGLILILGNNTHPYLEPALE